MNLQITKDYDWRTEQLVVFLTSYSHPLFESKYDVLRFKFDMYDILIMLDEVEDIIDQAFKTMPKLRTVIVLGMCKDSVAGLELTNRLLSNEKYRGKLRFGFVGMITYDLSATCSLHPALPKISTYMDTISKEPYKSLLAKYGNTEQAIARIRKIDPGYHPAIINCYSFNASNTYDVENNNKISYLLDEWWSLKAPGDLEERFAHRHVHINLLERTNKFSEMFDEAFRITEGGEVTKQHYRLFI